MNEMVGHFLRTQFKENPKNPQNPGLSKITI